MSERLCIKNFISIKDFDWEIKEFNILTGPMSAGKSNYVKLFWFLERILFYLIFNQAFTRDDLNKTVFFDKVARIFNEMFDINGFDYNACKIRYLYSCNGSIFDLQATWDKYYHYLKWSSKYLDEHFKQ